MKAETRITSVDGAAEVFSAAEIVDDESPIMLERYRRTRRLVRVAGFFRYRIFGAIACLLRGHRFDTTFDLSTGKTKVCGRCLARIKE